MLLAKITRSNYLNLSKINNLYCRFNTKHKNIIYQQTHPFFNFFYRVLGLSNSYKLYKCLINFLFKYIGYELRMVSFASKRERINK